MFKRIDINQLKIYKIKRKNININNKNNRYFKLDWIFEENNKKLYFGQLLYWNELCSYMVPEDELVEVTNKEYNFIKKFLSNKNDEKYNLLIKKGEQISDKDYWLDKLYCGVELDFCVGDCKTIDDLKTDIYKYPNKGFEDIKDKQEFIELIEQIFIYENELTELEKSIII